MTQTNEQDEMCGHEECDMESCLCEEDEQPVLHEGWAGPAAPYPPELGR